MSGNPPIADLIADLKRRRDAPARSIAVDLPFADGVYRFGLGRREIAELERLCGHKDLNGTWRPIGVGAIFGRLARGRALLPSGEPDWGASAAEILAGEIVERDCVETIRLGLIGGGTGVVAGATISVNPGLAMRLVETYVIGRPLDDAWTLAFAVLGARMYGVEVRPESIAGVNSSAGEKGGAGTP